MYIKKTIWVMLKFKSNEPKGTVILKPPKKALKTSNHKVNLENLLPFNLKTVIYIFQFKYRLFYVYCNNLQSNTILKQFQNKHKRR